MTLEEQLQAEREARIRAEGERDGLAKAMEILASRLNRDATAERRRAYDRERKASRSTGIPPESVGIAPSSTSPFPSSFPPSPEPSSPYPLSFPPSSPPPVPPPSSAPRNEPRLEPQGAPRQTRKRQSKPEKPTDPRHAPLVQLLVSACQDATGRSYRFNGGTDAAAVRDLLASADQDVSTRGEAASAEVVRRWKIGLRWRWKNGEAPVQDLPSLNRRWQSCASTETAPPAAVSTGPTMSDFTSVLGTNLYGTEPD